MAWTCNASGTVDYVNAAWIEITGLDLHDSRKLTVWSRLVASNEYGQFADRLRNALTSGKAFRHEAPLKDGRYGGEYRWHSLSICPVFASNGSVRSWTGIAVEVENRKRAERAEDALRDCKEQYEHEQGRAILLQDAILPAHLPEVAGLSFDAIYEPGRSDAQVGGDWYDAVRLLDGRVMLTIGDVAGSGLQAAVIMGVVRQIMRGIAQLHAEPALMLDAADRALRLEYPDALVTAWVGILDLVSRTLTYASAGHPPPLLIDLRGGIHDLNHLTLPIGLRQGHQGHASTISISDGSALWLYTDGIIEASHNIIDGTSRLHEAALQLGAAVTEHPATAIKNFVIPDGSQDDVAILVVKIDLGEAERYITRTHFDSDDAAAASTARHSFAASLSATRFTDVDRANAEIVFGELCGNVARYGKGPVDIIVDSSGIQTVLHVIDRGIGFQHLSRLPKDPYSESGRGLFIIAAMTTEFNVSQRAGGGSHARAVLVGRYPVSLLRDGTLPVITDQVPHDF